MAIYGSKVYGFSRYASPPTDINVYPFTAQPLDYGKIKLTWALPSSTAVYSLFFIVRNSMGFPITVDDGDLIYKNTYSGFSALTGNSATTTDTGGFYSPITGSFSATNTATSFKGTVNSKNVTLTSSSDNSKIAVGQSVTYAASGYLIGANSGSGIIGGTLVTAISQDSNGIYTITLSDYATIPDGTTLTFSSASLALGKTYYYSAFIFANGFWQRVATAIGTSIKNYKTADVMYDSLPDIYKNSLSNSSSTSSNKNVDLYNFLRTFGVEYDLIKTKVENAKNRYDITNLDGRLIPALMDEMGFNYESGMGVQQGRRLLKHATDIYLNKGSTVGVKQFVSSFTGYNATINPFVNLFLTLDCSSFESGYGFWSSNGTHSTITSTTPALEGGLSAYVNTYSPKGYPNSQAGYLKLTATTASTTTNSSASFTYGASLDLITISSSNTNSGVPGYSYITLATDVPHGFAVGETVIIQGMSNTAVSGNSGLINGSWKITNVPTTTSFTFYVPLITTGSITLSPTGSPGTITAVKVVADTGFGPYTATITGMTTTNGLKVGQTISATAGTGTFNSSTVTVTSIINNSSITVSATAAITAGNITNISVPGTVQVYDPTNYGIPVSAGVDYTFSIASYPKTTARSMLLTINWYDQYGTFISSSSPYAITNVLNTWTRLYTTNNVSPSNAVYAVPSISIASLGANGPFANNEVHYFDAAQFEKSLFLTGVSSSGSTLTVSSTAGIVPGSNVLATGGASGSLSSSSTTVVTSITGSTTLTVSPAPTSTLSNYSIEFSNPYQDARRIDLYLAPTRINQILNPGFELNATTNWTYTGTSATTVDPTNVYPTSSSGNGNANSSNSAKLTANSTTTTMTSASIPVTPGKAYSLSAYFKNVNGVNVTISVTWTKSVGSPQTDVSAPVTLSASSFTRVSLIPTATAMIAPANAVSAAVKFTFTGFPGAVYYVDSVLFEAATSANFYFDGATGYLNYEDVLWEQNAQGTTGTTSNSRSLYYPNRFLVQARLDSVINDYLPMGTSHALFIGTTAT